MSEPPPPPAGLGPAKKERFSRNFGLDLLRSLAISVVLLNHGFIMLFVGTGLVRWQGWPAAASACSVFSIEWLFVLSGFLIGSMMIRSFESKGQWWQSARDFWLRRWFRTLPNYYLFLLINVALVMLGIGPGRFYFSYAVFSQNLAWVEHKPLFFGEAWTLALDEWFYFLMPLLLAGALLVVRWGRERAFFAVALTLIALPTLARCLGAAPDNFFAWDDHVRRMTLLHLDATGWGVMAAILSRWRAPWWQRHQALKAACGLLLTLLAVGAMCTFMMGGKWLLFARGHFNDLLLISAPVVGVVLILPWLTAHAPKSTPVRWIVEHIGDYSYSIYLCHFPLLFIIVWVVKWAHWDMGALVWWCIPVWLTLVLLVSSVVFRTFEKPLSDLRESFTRRVQAGPFERKSAAPEEQT